MIDPLAGQGPLLVGREDLLQPLQHSIKQEERISGLVKRRDSHQGHRDGTAAGDHGKARVGAADSCNPCRRGDTAPTRRGAMGVTQGRGG